MYITLSYHETIGPAVLGYVYGYRIDHITEKGFVIQEVKESGIGNNAGKKRKNIVKKISKEQIAEIEQYIFDNIEQSENTLEMNAYRIKIKDKISINVSSQIVRDLWKKIENY